jgi:hypothetical protein
VNAGGDRRIRKAVDLEEVQSFAEQVNAGKQYNI